MAEPNRIPSVLATVAANPPYLARLTARFWCKVAKSEAGCWEWRSAKFPSGYGAFHVAGKQMKAHRVAWWLVNEELPADGMCVLHRCDNPACCNPDHLFLGTPTDNMRDCSLKGRHRSQRYPEAARASIAKASAAWAAMRRAVRSTG
jgi:hypothetical protein